MPGGGTWRIWGGGGMWDWVAAAANACWNCAYSCCTCWRQSISPPAHGYTQPNSATPAAQTISTLSCPQLLYNQDISPVSQVYLVTYLILATINNHHSLLQNRFIKGWSGWLGYLEQAPGYGDKIVCDFVCAWTVLYMVLIIGKCQCSSHNICRTV
jgi:hypothetical protein